MFRDAVTSSHGRCSFKILGLKSFIIFTGKTPVLKSLFNKVTGLKACNFIKRNLQHRCFLVNIVKFLRTPILKNICGCFYAVSFLQHYFHRKLVFKQEGHKR